MRRRLGSNPWALGLIVGCVFGAADLLLTWLYPLEEDSPLLLLRFYGLMFLIWILASLHASQRTGRLSSGVIAGMKVAFATFFVFTLFNFVRVNLFLKGMTARADWQNMMMRFRDSGTESLRLFVNLDYIKGTPFKIGVATVLGAAMGVVGGAVGAMLSSKSLEQKTRLRKPGDLAQSDD